MRSKLFVPGNRPALFAKALASAAEMLSFDLEDAVVVVQGWSIWGNRTCRSRRVRQATPAELRGLRGW